MNYYTEPKGKKNKRMSFKAFNFNPAITEGIKVMGYAEPTPIQIKSIPKILGGQDVMALAQTGTGKTASFILPILQRLMEKTDGAAVRALIIAPTRELAEQTHRVVEFLGEKTRIRGTSIYGGVSMAAQVQVLRRGVQIVSACPGRLLDHVQQGTIDLSNVEILVLDEADQMLEMGFLPDIKKILHHLPDVRQTLLFSATMPETVKILSKQILRDPAVVQIGHPAPVSTVSHTFYPVQTPSKRALLEKLLGETDTGRVIVFTKTKHRSKNVAKQLEQSGYTATALHGNLTQRKRQQSIDGFHKGHYQILVATDIAARGIDVQAVSHVINYDIPATVDAYTHRIGRTGRAGHTGWAFTFVGSEDGYPEREIKKALGNKLNYCNVKGFGCPDVLHLPLPTMKKAEKGKKWHPRRK